MAEEARPIVTTNLIFGVCVTAVGVVLALDRLHLANARELFRFWPVAVILFGASMVVDALRPESAAARSKNGKFFVIILLLILVTQTLQRDRDTQAPPTADRVSMFAVMGQDHRVSSTTQFRGGDTTSVMGVCRLDLRGAAIAPGEAAVLEVFVLMGGLVLQVPNDWIVEVEALPVMGGIQDRRGLPDSPDRRSRRRKGGAEAELEPKPDVAEQPSQASATPPPPNGPASEPAEASSPDAPGAEKAAGGPKPRLVLRGLVTMGGLTIRS